MKHLYQAEFLSQKLPSEEEFNKQFSKKYCGFIYFMERVKRFYHRLDNALPIGYETEYYDYDENNDDDYYYYQQQQQQQQQEPINAEPVVKNVENEEIKRIKRVKKLRKILRRRLIKKLLKFKKSLEEKKESD
jgi:hypothetical protein